MAGKVPLLKGSAAMPAPGWPTPDRNSLGLFEQQTDVGRVSRPGACVYDADRQAYTKDDFVPYQDFLG
jgi:hypothetical protein